MAITIIISLEYKIKQLIDLIDKCTPQKSNSELTIVTHKL